MTIEEVLKQSDELVPNTLSTPIKLLWLSELEGRLANEPIFLKFDDTTDTATKLYIPHPYDGIYISYLAMMIAMAVNDIQRYNSFLIKYNDDYAEFLRMSARAAQNNTKMRYGR